MLDSWLYIGIFFIIALFLPGAAIFIASILAPKKPTPLRIRFTNAVLRLSERAEFNSGPILYLCTGFPRF
jgi:NADH:ubiquinone oxidoreductase subunit 3 (subunit A)